MASSKKTKTKKVTPTDIEHSDFWTFIKSPNGQETIKTILDLFHSRHKVESSHKVIVIIAVIVASVLLSLKGAFNANISFMFGTLLGYIYARKDD